MEKEESTLDVREIELPDTSFIRDIESRVIQAITLRCLAKVEGISLLGANLIDNLFGREGLERIRGVFVEQDQKNHSVSIRVEVNIIYGISIPEKAEEIQSKIVEELSSFTGLHVASVHVVFKNLIDPLLQEAPEQVEGEEPALIAEESSDETYGDGL